MSKLYTIKNSEIELCVSDHGAELRSLKKNGKELMWQADPAFWGRTSPVLFPLVGNYWEKKSRHNGAVYELSQHGFARDMDFNLVDESPDSLLFELTDSKESKEKYPFSFVLQIGYALKGDKAVVSWTVKNPSNEEIFFSIGGHPAFNCDLGSAVLEYCKEGNPVDKSLLVNIIEGDGSGCLSDKTREIPLKAGRMQLSKELFDEDALIIENNQADSVSLIDGDGNKVLTVKFDAPLFGIWSPAGKNAPFVCIEPWYGRCDKVGFAGDISEREYSNTLKPGEEFSRSYTIEL